MWLNLFVFFSRTRTDTHWIDIKAKDIFCFAPSRKTLHRESTMWFTYCDQKHRKATCISVYGILLILWLNVNVKQLFAFHHPHLHCTHLSNCPWPHLGVDQGTRVRKLGPGGLGLGRKMNFRWERWGCERCCSVSSPQMQVVWNLLSKSKLEV